MPKIGSTEYKYVIMHAVMNDIDIDVPFIFPKTMVHQHVAIMMRAVIKSSYPKISDMNDITVRSAGTITFRDIYCSDKSETLNVSSHEGDSDIIKVNPYTAGIEDGGYTIKLIQMAEEQERLRKRQARK